MSTRAQQLRGSYFDDVREGNVFSQSATPLGLAIPIYTATAIAGGMPIWNPPNSGVDVELIRVDLAYGSGTAEYASIGVMMGYVQAISTASGLSAFAATSAVNAYTARQGGSRVSSSNAGTVTVTAGVATAPVLGVTGAGWIRTLASINLEAQTGTAHGTIVASYSFSGTLVVAPGTLVYLAAGRASTALYASCVIWREVPVL